MLQIPKVWVPQKPVYKNAIYKKCGEDGSDHPESTCKQIICPDSNGDHLADSRLHEAWKREKEVMKIKYTQDHPFSRVMKKI